MRSILLFLTAALFLVSCSKSKDEPDKPGPTTPDPTPPSVAETNALPVKIVMEANGAKKIYTIVYLPGTDKIDKITEEGGSVERYQYNGDLIEKIQHGTSSNGDFKKFEYENNVLIREIDYRQNVQTGKVEYSRPSGTSLVVTGYQYKNDRWEQDEASVTLEFDANGNLMKGKGPAGEVGEIRINLTYDSKNTPVINVAGWSEINFTGGVPLGDNIGIADIFGRSNNPVKVAVTATDGSMDMDITYTYEFKDTTQPKFPTQITGKGNNNVLFTAEISYK